MINARWFDGSTLFVNVLGDGFGEVLNPVVDFKCDVMRRDCTG